MKPHLIFVPYIILSLVVFNTQCEEQNIIRDQILEWWKEMSVQKPLKCELNPEFLQRHGSDSSFSPKIAKHFFRDDQRINLVQSRPCEENEKMTYDFTGNNAKVIDGKFEGPGKLTIHQVQEGAAIKIESNETRACADRNSYNGKLVKKSRWYI